MADQDGKNPIDSSATDQRASASANGGDDWAAVLRELEQREARLAKMRALKTPLPVPPTPRASAPTPRPIAAPKPAAPEESRQVPVATPRQMIERFSEILTAVNTPMNQLKKFEAAHPTIIAPNVYRVWEDGLKEASLVLFREFSRLRQRVTEETGEEM